MLLAIATLYGNIHLYRKRKHSESTGLSSYIEACCVWMLFLLTVTEVFSVWHGVRFLTLFGIWGLLDGGLLVLLVVQWKQYEGQTSDGQLRDGEQAGKRGLVYSLRKTFGDVRRFFREAPY